MRQAREEIGRAGEHDGRDFARGATDREDAAGHDTREGLREDDAEDGLEFSSAKREAGFAEAEWNGFEGFFGGDDDDGQGHHGESERGPEEGSFAPNRFFEIWIEGRIHVLADE